MKKIVACFLLWFSVGVYAQTDSLFRYKKIPVQDTICFHQTGTNPFLFKLYDASGKPVDTTFYKVDFSQSKIYLKPGFYRENKTVDSLEVRYRLYPDFLTQKYRIFNPKQIFASGTPTRLEDPKPKLTGKPLEGLDTQGNIIRGIRIGNNQDAVLNSVLDLSIAGQLSSKVQLEAHINDTNVPLQENGYSQDLKDIDRVYIALTGPKWQLEAGDVFLKDSTRYFMGFNKKVSGVSLQTQGEKFCVSASGALVRGRYTRQNFQGQESNQGPYKLRGNNGEAYIFIIKGSEKVYIDGILQSRGKDQDYLIDYNTAEITFNPTHPITSDMRISVEYQYTERNYTRFITHETAAYKTDTWGVGLGFYHESDAKNSPLQMQLTDEQKNLLAQSGNNTDQLMVPDVTPTEYDENKILYRKVEENGHTHYEYSDDTEETLYRVRFSFVGSNKGDYQVLEHLGIGKKMEYVGENQGDYVALIPLIAPTKQQIIALNSYFKPNTKSDVSVELAYSDNDNNLFATDNTANKAPAIKAKYLQVLLDSTNNKGLLTSSIQFDYIHKHFKSIERLYNIEFNRDWGLQNKKGNQSYLKTQLRYSKGRKADISYRYENLGFSETYRGNKNGIRAIIQQHKFRLKQDLNYLQAHSSTQNIAFIRNQSAIRYQPEKWWVGSRFDFESQKTQNTADKSLDKTSFRLADFRSFIGLGDTTKVFVETGYNRHRNDSLVHQNLKKVNDAQSLYLKTQLLRQKNTQLRVYAYYRKINYTDRPDNATFNSSIDFHKMFFQQMIQWQTRYQNTSGSLAQHDYTYVETEPGQGYYAWNDYNQNGIQELDEFEIAQFQDEAKFLRVSLPNIRYIPTQKAEIQQNIRVDFSKIANRKNTGKFWTHWYDNFRISAENNRIKTTDFVQLNPFETANENTLTKRFVLQNSLFYNRGKQQYTTAYNYSDSRQKNWQSFGSLYNRIRFHEILFQHRIQTNWQMELWNKYTRKESENERYSHRDYRINEQLFAPKITYLFSLKNRMGFSYQYVAKKNQTGEKESLFQHTLSLTYTWAEGNKNNINASVKAIKNDFSGKSYSAVGYQMLDGLQPDNNMTWSLLWTRKLNSFLYLNLNYNGRSNSFTRTIHNGNIQLRASF